MDMDAHGKRHVCCYPWASSLQSFPSAVLRVQRDALDFCGLLISVWTAFTAAGSSALYFPFVERPARPALCLVLNRCDFESSPHQRQYITRLRGYEETLEDDVFAAPLPLLLSALFFGPCPCRCPCPRSRDVYARPPISRNPFTGSETEDLCTKCGLIVTANPTAHHAAHVSV